MGATQCNRQVGLAQTTLVQLRGVDHDPEIAWKRVQAIVKNRIEVTCDDLLRNRIGDCLPGVQEERSDTQF